MTEFEEQIKLRLTLNANDFDVIVLNMLKEIERLNNRVKELEHEKESHEYICTKCYLRKSPDMGVQNW